MDDLLVEAVEDTRHEVAPAGTAGVGHHSTESSTW